jgi:hypothetical protein
MKIKTRYMVLSLVVVIPFIVPGMLFSQKPTVTKQQFSASTAVFFGKAVLPTRQAPPMGTAPRLSAADQVVRAQVMTGRSLSFLTNNYTFSLTPAIPYNGNRGYLNFIHASMVIANPNSPSVMLNDGQWVDLILKVPSTAGKVLQIELKVIGYGTNLKVEGMGSTQTFWLTGGTLKRLTLLTLLPVLNDDVGFVIYGTGSSWFFYGVDISTIN